MLTSRRWWCRSQIAAISPAQTRGTSPSCSVFFKPSELPRVERNKQVCLQRDSVFGEGCVGENSFSWPGLLGQIPPQSSTAEVWPGAGQRNHSICQADLRIGLLQR